MSLTAECAGGCKRQVYSYILRRAQETRDTSERCTLCIACINYLGRLSMHSGTKNVLPIDNLLQFANVRGVH